MDLKTIDKIVWWIPIRKLRNDLRNILYEIKYNNDVINDVISSISKKDYINTCKINDIDFLFFDSITSNITNGIAKEIENEYNLNNIDFKEGDIVIDIGGNVGMVSIYLAKKYPFLKIYSFEPLKQNYENFLKNIELNKIPKDIITVENLAITKDGRDVNILFCPYNTGSSNI